MTTHSATEDLCKLSVLLNKSVHRRLKRKAFTDDQTITEVVTYLIEKYLAGAIS